MNTSKNIILFTVDVEDWFQVENFKSRISLSSWPSYELRVEKNVHRLLDLLDLLSAQEFHSDSSSKLQATFFVLAWIAERLPGLIREINARGHEIASHGYSHNLCFQQSPIELKKDLLDSKKLLEDIIGEPIFGYRAPSFSINSDALKVVEDCGYLYDSSFNSFGLNERYGKLALSENDKKGILYKLSSSFFEFPISNLKIGGLNLPMGGGGYFRLFPFSVFRWGIRSILKKEKAYLFYMHPWEIDPEQPRVAEISPLFKFRHYINLEKTYGRISSLINDFKDCRFISCSQYINDASKSNKK